MPPAHPSAHSSFDAPYAPTEASAFEEAMMDFSPSYGDYPSTSSAFDGTSYRPSSADGLYPPVSAFSLPAASATARTPSPLATYTGAVAPFSQLPFSSSIMPFGSSASYGTAQPGSSAAGSSLAMQAAIHQQQRSAFLNPRSVELSAQQAPVTITPTALTASQRLASASASSSASSTPPPAPPPRKTASSSSSAAASSSAATKKARAASPAVSVSASSSAAKKARESSRATASPAPSSTRSAASPDADPVALWLQALPGIRSHLTQRRLTSSPLSSAQKLVGLLSEFSHTDRSSSASRWGDASDVPPEGRAEVLTALIRYAKDDFWKAWVEVGKVDAANVKGKGKEKDGASQAIVSDGLELLQVWLDGASKAFVKDKDGAKEKERDRKRKELEQASLALVLQVLAKLPVTIKHLMAYSSIPRRAKRVSDKASDGAVKGAANHLVHKWTKLQESANLSSNGANGSSSAAPKRKSETNEAPAKKVKTATSTASAASTVKKPVPAPTSAAKALPSFKKAAPAPKPDDPLARALANLKAAKTFSAGPAVSNAQTTLAKLVGNAKGKKEESGAVSTAGDEPKKKKKTVRWKPDEELCMYQMIEAREAATEAVGGDFHGMMEQQEGMTLHMHYETIDEMEEELDWNEPKDIVLSDDEAFAGLFDPKRTPEVEVQEAREANLMAVDDTTTPPDSPGEAPEETITPDEEIRKIQLHEDLSRDDTVLLTIKGAQEAPRALASDEQISALLGQLTANGLAQQLESVQGVLSAQTNPHQPPFGAGAPQPSTQQIDENTLAMLRTYPPEQVVNLVRDNPLLQGIDLHALGILAPPHGYAAPPPVQGYAPVPHAQTYDGYVPPASYHVPPPNGGADPYSGYRPPGGPLEFVPNPHMRGSGGGQKGGLLSAGSKKDVPCKFFRTRNGCDWGSRSANAFSGTYPIVAWSSSRSVAPLNPSPRPPVIIACETGEWLDRVVSGSCGTVGRDIRLTSLAQLDPAQSSSSRSAQSAQRAFSAEVDDLCDLASLFVVSVPGLHNSDLSLLPSVSDSPSGIKSSLASARVAGNALTFPYVSEKLARPPPEQFVRRFRKQCAKDKVVKLVKVDGLAGDFADEKEEVEKTKEALARADKLVGSLMTSASTPYAVIVTSLPTSLPARPCSKKHTNSRSLKKRQAPGAGVNDDAIVEELLEEIAEEDQLQGDTLEKMVETMQELEDVNGQDSPAAAESTTSPDYADKPEIGVTDVVEPTEEEYAHAVDPYTVGEWEGSVLDVSPLQDDEDDGEGNGNGTSIFQPDPKSGIFHRYTLFSPGILFAIIVSFLVLIPTVVIGSHALLSIETVQGLETKMQGSVGLDPSKQ
uniref:BY PROTMAP: gi/342320596/gb/EGU12535.1/ Proteophosphoglycan ppg4 [Rhodotorula glutinis ATCC 204091] n=1 Tax=Rhodotorula toruloides TaxID=5286 RepID=A0A0K3C6P9_RHOTO